MSIAITGGAGFLGSHVVEHLLLNTNEQIYLIDKLDTATFSFERVNRFRTFENRINLLALDFTKPISEGVVELLSGVTCIIHLGAQTHVDTSITNPMAFVEANVVGTCNMLELARRLPYLQRFFYFSTDEVFGPAPEVAGSCPIEGGCKGCCGCCPLNMDPEGISGEPFVAAAIDVAAPTPAATAPIIGAKCGMFYPILWAC